MSLSACTAVSHVYLILSCRHEHNKVDMPQLELAFLSFLYFHIGILYAHKVKT